MTSRLKTTLAAFAVVILSLSGAACTGGEDLQVNVGESSPTTAPVESEPAEAAPESTTCFLEEVEDEYGMMVEVETCE